MSKQSGTRPLIVLMLPDDVTAFGYAGFHLASAEETKRDIAPFCVDAPDLRTHVSTRIAPAANTGHLPALQGRTRATAWDPARHNAQRWSCT